MATVEMGSVPALVGKAGEALVATALMRRGVYVAYPAYDGGVDLLAYREHNFKNVVPIQVKARSGPSYTFQRRWFNVPGLVLVQVWHVASEPQFYVFGGLAHVEEGLQWPHWRSETPSATQGANQSDSARTRWFQTAHGYSSIGARPASA